jgi:hypothetical protein
MNVHEVEDGQWVILWWDGAVRSGVGGSQVEVLHVDLGDFKREHSRAA